MDKNSRLVKNIQNLLEDNQLKEAIDLLNNSIHTINNGKLLDRLMGVETLYKNMLNFFLSGNADNDRDKFYNNIKHDLIELAQTVDFETKVKNDNSQYFATARLNNLSNYSLTGLIQEYIDFSSVDRTLTDKSTYLNNIKSAEEKLQIIFEYIWANPFISVDDRKVIQTVLERTDLEVGISRKLKMIILSSLFLGTLQYYNKNNLITILLFLSTCKDEYLLARALVFTYLILKEKNKFILNDSEISDIMHSLLDNEYLQPYFEKTIFNVLSTRDTEKLNKKFKEDVLPSLLKLKPEIEKKLKDLGAEDINISSLEENPEWHDIMDNKGLTDKLKELTELQMSGGDVMMLAFENMKGFPFFNKVSNWFLPFDSSYSEFLKYDDTKYENLIQLFAESNYMLCDSDKYSFAFALNKMPESQRSIIISQFEAQANQIKEDANDSFTSKLTVEIGNCVKELYRFFNLYNRKEDFNNPFYGEMNLMSIPFFSEIINNDETIGILGEYFFSRKDYVSALPYFKLLSKNGDETVLQKLGYIYDVNQEPAEALKFYLKADIISSNNKWLLRRIALAYRNIGQFDNSIKYYKSLLQLDHENLSTILQLGHVYLADNKISEALDCYYKILYLDENNTKALHPIVWCELISGNFDKSIAAYKQMPSSVRKFSDHINAGHALLGIGKVKKALEMYKIASKCGNLEEALKEDSVQLLKTGYNVSLFKFILDAVRYDM